MKIKFLLILAFILTDAVAIAQNNNAILTFEEAKELADKGNARCQAITSMFYRIGWQTDKNEMLAEEYVTKSVNAGHPLGAYYFGKYLVEGINGKKDESRGHQIQKESFEPLRLIAADTSKPDPVAVTAIGEMLMEGKACAQDKRKGIDCFKWAAQHHYIPAQFLYITSQANEENKLPFYHMMHYCRSADERILEGYFNCNCPACSVAKIHATTRNWNVNNLFDDHRRDKNGQYINDINGNPTRDPWITIAYPPLVSLYKSNNEECKKLAASIGPVKLDAKYWKGEVNNVSNIWENSDLKGKTSEWHKLMECDTEYGPIEIQIRANYTGFSLLDERFKHEDENGYFIDRDETFTHLKRNRGLFSSVQFHVVEMDGSLKIESTTPIEFKNRMAITQYPIALEIKFINNSSKPYPVNDFGFEIKSSKTKEIFLPGLSFGTDENLRQFCKFHNFGWGQPEEISKAKLILFDTFTPVSETIPFSIENKTCLEENIKSSLLLETVSYKGYKSPTARICLSINDRPTHFWASFDSHDNRNYFSSLTSDITLPSGRSDYRLMYKLDHPIPPGESISRFISFDFDKSTTAEAIPFIKNQKDVLKGKPLKIDFDIYNFISKTRRSILVPDGEITGIESSMNQVLGIKARYGDQDFTDNYKNDVLKNQKILENLCKISLAGVISSPMMQSANTVAVHDSINAKHIFFKKDLPNGNVVYLSGAKSNNRIEGFFTIASKDNNEIVYKSAWSFDCNSKNNDFILHFSYGNNFRWFSWFIKNDDCAKLFCAFPGESSNIFSPCYPGDSKKSLLYLNHVFLDIEKGHIGNAFKSDIKPSKPYPGMLWLDTGQPRDINGFQRNRVYEWVQESSGAGEWLKLPDNFRFPDANETDIKSIGTDSDGMNLIIETTNNKYIVPFASRLTKQLIGALDQECSYQGSGESLISPMNLFTYDFLKAEAHAIKILPQKDANVIQGLLWISQNEVAVKKFNQWDIWQLTTGNIIPADENQKINFEKNLNNVKLKSQGLSSTFDLSAYKNTRSGGFDFKNYFLCESSNRIFLSGQMDGQNGKKNALDLSIFDIDDKKCVSQIVVSPFGSDVQFSSNTEFFNQIALSPQNDYAVAATKTGNVLYFVDLKNDFVLLKNPHNRPTPEFVKYCAVKSSSAPDIFSIAFNDGYYLSGDGSADGVTITDGYKALSIAQMEIKYNRPDIVLERLGAPKNIVADAKRLRERLARRSDFKNLEGTSLIDIPVVKISAEIPQNVASRHVSIPFTATNPAGNLKHLLVYNNGALLLTKPLLGRDGNPSYDFQGQIDFELASGENKIQLCAVNESGIPSAFEKFIVTCSSVPATRNTYIVTCGVSEYKDTNFNLRYAAKDAGDAAEALKKSAESRGFTPKVLTLKNGEVDSETVSKIRNFLASATADDEVFLFFAGHGLLDKDLNYHYARSDTDFSATENIGIQFDELESLIDGIKPLMRTILFDTCHSGEVEEESKADVRAMVAGQAVDRSEASNVQSNKIAIRGMKVNGIAPKVSHSELINLGKLFPDSRRAKGANILTSSSGSEFSMESDEWNNGLFTYSLIKALQDPATDENRDGVISFSEAAENVKKKVTQLSGGKQRPITRGVNREFDPILVKLPGAKSLANNLLPRSSLLPISHSNGSNLTPPIFYNTNEASSEESGGNRSDAPQLGDNYTVAYKGNDGVSIRSTPGGPIIATAYYGPDTCMTVVSDSAINADGLTWVQIKVSGWMAKRNLRNGDTNIAPIAGSRSVVTWDGGGDPNDNFIAMKTLGSKGKRIAKVYHRTEVELNESTISGNYEWAKADLTGWMPVRGPKGSTLIEPTKQ